MRPLLACLALMLAVVLAPASTAGAQEWSEREVERIVRDYLMREPEVILEEIEALQMRQEQAAAERRRDAIGRLRAEIFEDPITPVLGNPDGDVTLVSSWTIAVASAAGWCRRSSSCWPRIRGWASR
jgi:protein-disulfide isomerase